jgi:hypothetical protein
LGEASEGAQTGDIVISQIAVWGQLRGRRGGGVDLSFVRVADISGQYDARFISNSRSVNDLGARAQIGPDMSF